MVTTRIYDRLPSDAGVTFEGFEDIKIKSRESVKEKLEDFMNYCKNARKPAIRVILGEWGEGKTDAYKRYIEPKAKADNNYSFFVSASTLSNGYQTAALTKLLESTSLSAIRFLVVLFNCIREECGEKRIPDPQHYQYAIDYLNSILSNLINGEKERRIFIFIDEFEELLLIPEVLRNIISGIKEVINGSYKVIDEGGEYEGCIHLIIAATPDAYYRLQVHEETSLIFGGLGRRVGVINLPQIGREEGITFLFYLLKYAYKDNLPQPFPFTNLGIFNTLFRITQGNPGNMVSLFTRLMSSAQMDKDVINVIDSEHLLKFLEKEHVFVYGGSTACIETERFQRFLKIIEEQRRKDIGEKCSLLFKKIVGEFKPFSIEDLKSSIKYHDVINLVAIINDNLRRNEGIERAILKVSPLREDKTFRDVVDALKDFVIIEKGEKYIKIDNYLERLETLEDRISYFEYENGNIIQRIYLPSEKYSIMSFFEGIGSDRASELEHIINRRLCEDENYYVASEELLSQIFPTPVPRELDFIKNREKRLKLWRDITKDLAAEYERYMPTAFIYLIKKSGAFSISETEYRESRHPACFAELMLDDVKINALFFSINGDVRGTYIEEIWNLIRGRKPPVHCILLIFTGELLQEARDKIESKEMGKEGENVILEVKLHPTLAKRIICIYKASNIKEDIDERLLSLIIEKTVKQELDILTKLKSWLKEQEGKGIAITDLPIEATSNLREFADALKFFINFMECESTAEEIFQKNQELRDYTKYDSKKVGLIPDVDLPKFTKIVRDLLNNRFLISSKDEYKIQPHPVEKRILKILEKETKLSEKELETFFIIKKGRYLSDVFIPILEYKGLLRKEGNNYLLTNKNELFSEVEKYYNRFKKLASEQRYQNYGFIYMTKERGWRFISLKDFDSFIDKLYNQLEIFYSSKELSLQKLSLAKRMLEHFLEEILPLFEKASTKAEILMSNALKIQTDVKDHIDEIRKEFDKWLKLEFRTEKVEEYTKVQEILKEIERSSTFSDSEIREIIEKFEEEEKKVFFFRNEEEKAFYFNPKLYKIQVSFESLGKVEKEINEAVEKLKSQFGSFNRRQKKIESDLKSREINDRCKISSTIFHMLVELNNNILPKTQPVSFEVVSLKELLKYVQQNEQSINSNLDFLVSCITSLDDLYKIEEKFVNNLEECSSLSSHLLSVFDIEEYNDAAKSFERTLGEIKSQYENYSQIIHLESAQSMSTIIKDFKSKINNLDRDLVSQKNLVISKWNDYVRLIKEFVSSKQNILKLLFQKSSIKTNLKGIENQLEAFGKYASIDNIKELYVNLSDLERMKHEIGKTFCESLKDVLTEKELLLIEFLMGEIRKRKDGWLSIDEVYQFVKDKLHLDPSEVSKILEKLINQGFLKTGVTLAF